MVTRPPRTNSPAKSRPLSVRQRSAQTTRDSILRAAIRIFARYGFDGGRVEQISKAARSHDRMIYYYFGSKEKLFAAVIEEIYRRMDEAESALELSGEPPRQALAKVIRFVWNYYQDNPEFVTLLNSENLHKGKHVSRLSTAQVYSSKAISIIAEILAEGAARGEFRDDLVASEVYLLIAASCYFYCSNRYTLTSFLGWDLADPAKMAGWEAFTIDSVLRVVQR